MALFFFSKKNEIKFPIGEYLQVDIHSHVLPGIDDGAKDIAASIALLNGLYQLGIRTVIGTPHVMADIHRNNPQTITVAYTRLSEALKGATQVPTVHFAAEHMLDDGFDALLGNEQVVPYRGTPYILVETPFLSRPLNLEHLAFQLTTGRYKPILAHPERYHYLFGKPADYETLKSLGFALQLNALSLVGYYGEQEKKAAHWLLEHQLVDYIGTDIHHERHLRRLIKYKLPRKTIQLLEQTTIHNTRLIAASPKVKTATTA